MGKEVKKDELDKDQQVQNEEQQAAEQPTEPTEGETDSSADEQAAFLAGFSKVSNVQATGQEPETSKQETTTEPATSEAEEEESDPEAEQEEGEEAESEPEKPKEKTELEKAYERIAKLEGRYGNLLQKVSALTASQQKAAAASTAPQPTDSAPTQSQVRAALKNEDKLKELIEEFPSFEPMLEELKAIREDSAKSEMSKVDRDKLVEEATQNALYIIENESLVRDFPTWEQDVKSKEFRKFSLEGGPSEAEFAHLQRISQANPAGAENVINSWMGLYPDWWEDKGSLIFSDRPSDTRRIMSLYTESLNQSQQQQTNSSPKPKKDRLRRAVTPRGTTQPLATEPTDQEAFLRGFNRARGR